MALSRTEIARVAGFLGYLLAKHKSWSAATAAAGVSRVTFWKLCARPSFMKVTRPTLSRIAAAENATVEDLVAGMLPMAVLQMRRLYRVSPEKTRCRACGAHGHNIRTCLHVESGEVMAKKRSIESLTKEFIKLHGQCKRLEDVKAALVTAMTIGEHRAVDVPGVGAVMLVPARQRYLVDVDELTKRYKDLARRLREAGQEASEDVPMRPQDVKPWLEVKPPVGPVKAAA